MINNIFNNNTINNYILNLRGDNKKLAIFEFENLWKLYFKEEIKLKNIESTYYEFNSKIKIKKYKQSKKIKNFLFRLTYINNISKIIFKSNSFNEFKKQLNLINLNKYENNINNKSFMFRIKKTKIFNLPTQINEQEIAKLIFKKIKNPKVDLKKPDNEFNLIINSNLNEFIFSEKIFNNQKQYKLRMPKLRPVVMPYTLKSDMARAAINCLNIKKGIILDPFCGIGGILLEAKDMNFKVIGNDISKKDILNMNINFKYYFNNFIPKSTQLDSRTLIQKKNTISGIVTDIPYGKSSKKLGVDLYEKFLQNAQIYLKKNCRIVIIFANFTEIRDLAKKYFTEIIEIEEYINISMTRYILVLENNKK